MALKHMLMWIGQAKVGPIRCPSHLSHNTCEDCHDRKMAGYRPDVLTDPAYWTDEPIDDD
jgi:hypothetical protein